MELIGLYLIGAALLAVAGLAKAIRPDDTARALGNLLPLRLRSRWSQRRLRSLVRLGAVGEASLGVVACLAPRPLTAALVATSYGVFFGVVLLVRVKGGALATCGCFGRPDTPATRVHALLNVVLAAGALTIALRAQDGGTITSILAHQPWAGLPLLFACAVGVWLSVLALSALAALDGVRRMATASATTSQPHGPRDGGAS